jgi:hypothetical protein
MSPFDFYDWRVYLDCYDCIDPMGLPTAGIGKCPADLAAKLSDWTMIEGWISQNDYPPASYQEINHKRARTPLLKYLILD